MSQVPIDSSAVVGNKLSSGLIVIRPDLAYMCQKIANFLFWGPPNAGDRKWVLIDTGVVNMSGTIMTLAEERFGKGARPAAIILTHAHFDHIGAVQDLAEAWNCPVYAHTLELPYITGTLAYQTPDPTVGGGMMALMSPMFPQKPIDLGERARPLPEDGTVPNMPGWKWIATPGHTPGHVALWRECEKIIIAGDALCTTTQESAYAVMTQRPELHGPPKYFTTNWQNAKTSVQILASLEPELLITGHGPALEGKKMRDALRDLAERFEEVAVPDGGKFVENPEPQLTPFEAQHGVNSAKKLKVTDVRIE